MRQPNRKNTKSQRNGLSEFASNPERVGAIHLTESQYVELILPPDINDVVRVVRVINNAHRIVVMLDDETSENVGGDFLVETSDREGLHTTNIVELA